MSMVTWKDVLLEIATWPSPLYVKQVAEFWRWPAGHAGRRIQILRSYGYVKYADRSKRGWGGYLVTPWGHTMAEKWRKEDANTEAGARRRVVPGLS